MKKEFTVKPPALHCFPRGQVRRDKDLPGGYIFTKTPYEKHLITQDVGENLN